MATPTHNLEDTTPRPITKTSIGQESVARVAAILTRKRFNVKSHLPYTSPFDLLCNGKRVEVKTADLRKDTDGTDVWTVNIHRHGELDESQVDVYAIELRAPFLEQSVLLLYAAPLGVKTLGFTPFRLMRGKYADAVENWAILGPRQKNPTLNQIFAGHYNGREDANGL